MWQRRTSKGINFNDGSMGLILYPPEILTIDLLVLEAVVNESRGRCENTLKASVGRR